MSRPGIYNGGGAKFRDLLPPTSPSSRSNANVTGRPLCERPGTTSARVSDLHEPPGTTSARVSDLHEPPGTGPPPRGSWTSTSLLGPPPQGSWTSTSLLGPPPRGVIERPPRASWAHLRKGQRPPHPSWGTPPQGSSTSTPVVRTPPQGPATSAAVVGITSARVMERLRERGARCKATMGSKERTLSPIRVRRKGRRTVAWPAGFRLRRQGRSSLQHVVHPPDRLSSASLAVSDNTFTILRSTIAFSGPLKADMITGRIEESGAP